MGLSSQVSIKCSNARKAWHRVGALWLVGATAIVPSPAPQAQSLCLLKLTGKTFKILAWMNPVG